MKAKRAAANSTRMGMQLIDRIKSGKLIDRPDMKRRGVTKNVKHLTVPSALSRFFKPVGQKEAR